MKRSIKSVLITFMLLAALLFVTACADSNYYDKYDAEGYTVSVKFDANGGQFTTNTSVIQDTFNISGMNKNANGNVELALLSPDNAIRGESNHFTPVKNGYFLAGWYTERTETGTDENGNPVYTYANKWDFESQTYEVDPSKEYSASEPVLTLYAAWVPMFQINFYSISDGELIGNYTFNPLNVTEIKVPQWNETTGAMDMFSFPSKAGYTFDKAYYDVAATIPAEGTITHAGSVNQATGTAENPVMDLYVEMIEGEWFHIYNIDQFIKNARINGSYILHTDLVFGDGKFWPNGLTMGTFTGTIEGNGHTISNVQLVQKDTSRVNGGLFGALSATAQLKDLVFDNITFTIENGTRIPGASFGVLAGTINSGAKLMDVKVVNSKLRVNENVHFITQDYAIGKLCGVGYTNAVDFSGITCEIIDKDGNVLDLSQKLLILEHDNDIVLEFK